MTVLMKVLIIRFSSFGDIAQTLFATEQLKKQFPHAEIHWVTRADQAAWLEKSGLVDKVWSVDPAQGFKGLWQVCRELRMQFFTHIYDAHNNVRSHWVSFYLKWFWLGQKPRFVRRSKERVKRWLLFGWGVNRYKDWPYRGAYSFLKPLERAWGLRIPPLEEMSESLPSLQTEALESEVESWVADSLVLAPSANWKLKRWPLEHWKSLVELCPEERFTVLAGPEDQFVEDIVKVAPDRVRSFAGKLSWSQSIAVVARAKGVISGDTGILHMADFLGRPSLALMGPTAFGFPYRSSTNTLHLGLSCSPCTKDGRGRCNNSVYKQCLKDITPEMVTGSLESLS